MVQTIGFMELQFVLDVVMNLNMKMVRCKLIRSL